MFCKICGRNIDDHYKCPYCHSFQGNKPADEYIDISATTLCKYSRHSAAIAGFLQIFLGAFGVGRFYLGYRRVGLLQILATVLTCGIGGFIWGVIDGVLLLGNRIKYDYDGKLLL